MVCTTLSLEDHSITVISDRIKNYQNSKVQNKTLEILLKHENIVIQNSSLRRVQYAHSEMSGGEKKKKKQTLVLKPPTMHQVSCNLINTVNSFAMAYINPNVNQERYGRREVAMHEDNYELHDPSQW